MLPGQGELDCAGPRRGAAELQRSEISRERGMLFFSKHCLLPFPRPVLVGFTSAPGGTPGHALAGGEAGLVLGDREGGLIFPALQSRAARLLCEPPQVATIFLKDLSVCRSKLIS